MYCYATEGVADGKEQYVLIPQQQFMQIIAYCYENVN